MLDAVANGASRAHRCENTPPLHFTLAWLTSQFGDPAATIRLPSIVFGAATVPVVYAFGRRTVGRSARRWWAPGSSRSARSRSSTGSTRAPTGC